MAKNTTPTKKLNTSALSFSDYDFSKYDDDPRSSAWDLLTLSFRIVEYLLFVFNGQPVTEMNVFRALSPKVFGKYRKSICYISLTNYSRLHPKEVHMILTDAGLWALIPSKHGEEGP